MPLFHTTGCQSTLIPSLAQGAKIVMMRKWDAELALKLIERERINSAGGVPTIVWQLLEHPDRDKYDISSLDIFAYGGAPAPAELVRRIKTSPFKAMPYTAWGMTETSAAFTVVVGEDYEAHPDCCGRALPVGDIRIVGPDGRDVPLGETGEVWARGPNVVKGYWGQPAATEQVFGGGWLRTGDIGRLDEEGFLTIVDRAKDMLIRGGENIYCIEVENALFEHPAVADAAVVGIPHHTLGEEPAAVVTLRPGMPASETELRAFVAERLAAFKVPVRVIATTGLLPRNPNGKIMKRELKGMFERKPLLPPGRERGNSVPFRRNRRVLAYQLLLLQFGPESGGDCMVKGGEIHLDLRARDRAGNDRGDDGMAERELQRGGGERDAVARADRLDRFATRARTPDRPARNCTSRFGPAPVASDAGIVGPADHDSDAALGAARKLEVEHVLLEQRIAHRDQEEIDVEQVEIARDRAHRVETGADALDHALIAQLFQRAPAAGVELVQIRRRPRLGLEVPGVEVVDQQDVDAVDAEPLQAVLERAHHAVVAVVEHGVELEPAEPFAALERAGLQGRRIRRPILLEMT